MNLSGEAAYVADGEKPPEKRFGRVYISGRLFQSHEGILKVRLMIDKLDAVVMRAEYIYHRGCMEYVLWCPQFDILKPGDADPLYEVTLEGTVTKV